MGEWCASEEDDNQAVYVNLDQNRESYTAYDGKQVWDAIYKENCLIDNI